MFGELPAINNLTLEITKTYGYASGTKEHQSIYSLCIDYTFKLITARQFSTHIKELTGNKSDEFRFRLSQSVYVIRELKAFWIRQTKNCGRRLNLSALGRKYGIVSDDVRQSRSRDIQNQLNSTKFPKETVSLVSNTVKLAKRLNTIIEEVQEYCNRFVSKKLLFVLKSCNLEVHDLGAEIMCKAIIAYYQTSTQPMNKLHTLNFLRRTSKNQGLNMIKWFTSKKRSRLNRTGHNEYALIVISDNQLMGYSGGDGGVISYEDLSQASVTDDTESIILKQSVLKMKKLIKQSPVTSDYRRDLRLIKILMGIHDEAFSKWMRGNRNLRHSNDEYIDRVKGSTYTRLAADFLEYDAKDRNAILNLLREKLG